MIAVEPPPQPRGKERQGSDIVIYRNPRAWRVRIAQAAIWAFPAALIWIAATAPAGTSAGELALVWSLAAVAAVLLLAFEIYLRVYVIEISTEREAVRITALATFHHRVIRPGAIVGLGAERHERGSFGLSPSFNNRWLTLKLPGQWPPLIIDVTPPARLDRAALQRAAQTLRRAGDVRGQRR